MVFIEAKGPQTVELSILLSFCLDFILVSPYFLFRSVLPKLQASSGKIGEAVQATQGQQNWRYIVATANIIGAAWHSALIGEAGERSPHLQAKRAEFVAPILSFCGFFHVHCASPIVEYASQDKQYWRSIRKTKEQAKRGTLFEALCLLLQKSPNNLAVLTGNGNMFDTRRRQNKN